MTRTTDHTLVRRRRLMAGLALGAACAALPAAASAQATAPPAASPRYGRRRVRGMGDVLFIGGSLAAIFGWVVWRGKRARQKEEAAREMQVRLARARERSKNL